MSQQAIKMGPEAKIKFGLSAVLAEIFDFTDGDVTIDVKDHDTNDSAQATYDQSRYGRRKLSATIKGHSASDVNVLGVGSASDFGSPVAYVEIYPWGLAGDPYIIPSFQLTQFRFTAPAKSGEPSTIEFSGHSSGAFSEPGE